MGFFLGLVCGMFVLALIAVIFGSGNDDEGNTSYESKESYFDGSVVVTYIWYSHNGNDEILFEFLSPGTYRIEFGNTDKPKDHVLLPDDFPVTIGENTPQTRHISRHEMPKNLTVTIIENDCSETHYL
jgi:hypothetical protein